MTSWTAGPPSRRVDFGTVLIQQFNLTKQRLISGCLNTQSPVNSVNIVLVFSLSRIQLTIQKYWFWCKIPMWCMPQKHQTDYFCLFDRQVYLFLLKAQVPKPWCTSLLPHEPLFTLLKITSTKKRKTKQKTKLVFTQHHKVTGKGGYGRSCPKKFTNDWKMQPTDQTTTQPLLVRLRIAPQTHLNVVASKTAARRSQLCTNTGTFYIWNTPNPLLYSFNN